MFNWLKQDSKETDKKILLEAWKQCVDVQMHFNDMEMRIRSFAVTVMTAVSGAIGYLIKENNTESHFIALLSFVGISAWLCFYLMDRFMYHKLLIGAVNSGINIEKDLNKLGINVNLGEEISKASPLKKLFGTNLEIHSNQKLDFFYTTVPIICLNGILLYLVFGLWVLFAIPFLSAWGLYSLAKGYNKDKENYNWIPYRIFLLSNVLLMLVLFFVYSLVIGNITVILLVK